MLFGEYMNSTDRLLLPRTGKVLKNRTVLAAMTNKQSHENGILSQEEKKWLVRRAMGDFAIITTAATNVTEHGRGWVRRDGCLG